jgi:ElaB/YqjD/DUF883 family membrane-anchored ribosome-binding protein
MKEKSLLSDKINRETLTKQTKTSKEMMLMESGKIALEVRVRVMDKVNDSLKRVRVKVRVREFRSTKHTKTSKEMMLMETGKIALEVGVRVMDKVEDSFKRVRVRLRVRVLIDRDRDTDRVKRIIITSP